MESTQDSSIVPKWWRDAIVVPDGFPPPVRGNLARPCICGYPTDLEGERIVHLIVWSDGTLMFAHQDCVGSPPDA